MAGTLISYREGDAPGYAGRLFDRLRARLPKHQVRKDASQVAPGDDFVQAIENAVASSDTVLVIIGRDWIGSTSTSGRRLSDPNDPVRLEIGAALRGNQRVIPVLVGGASMPAEQDLPSEIRGLARRQAVELRDANWNQDVEVLIAAISRQKEAARSGPRPLTRPQRIALAVAAVAIIVFIALEFAFGPRGSDAADQGHPGIRLRPELTLVAHDDIESIATLPDRRIASFSRRDDEVTAWNLATGESESLYKEYGIASIVGIADGRLALGFWGYIKLLNPDSRKVEETIELHDPYRDRTDTSIHRLMTLPDGNLLSFSSVSVGFCDLKAHEGRVIPMGAVGRFAVLSGGRVALPAGGSGVLIWNFRDNKTETQLEGQPDSGPSRDLALLPDGRIATTSDTKH